MANTNTTNTPQHILNQSFDTTFEKLLAIGMTFDPTTGTLSRGYPQNPLNLKPFDYVSMVISPATTETYTFKSGGASGTVTNTVVIVYTDSTRADISTVTKI
jgi:hypothetical protein